MILTLLKSILKDDYPKPYTAFLELLSIFMTLMIFWYTSQAFKPRDLSTGSYFDYLFWGEFIIYLPFSMLQQNMRLAKKMFFRGTLDFLLTRKMSLMRYFMKFSFGYLFKDSMKLTLMLLLGIAFFNLEVHIVALFWTLVAIVSTSAFFVMLGQGIGMILLVWGRGESLVGQGLTLLSIMSGVYFPIAVLPHWLQKMSIILNPVTSYLELLRSLVRGHLNRDFLIIVLVWLIAIWLFNFLINRISLELYRRNGPASDLTI